MLFISKNRLFKKSIKTFIILLTFSFCLSGFYFSKPKNCTKIEPPQKEVKHKCCTEKSSCAKKPEPEKCTSKSFCKCDQNNKNTPIDESVIKTNESRINFGCIKEIKLNFISCYKLKIPKEFKFGTINSPPLFILNETLLI